jgi:hypothetical protein
LGVAVQFWPHHTTAKQPVFRKLFVVTLPMLAMKQNAVAPENARTVGEMYLFGIGSRGRNCTYPLKRPSTRRICDGSCQIGAYYGNGRASGRSGEALEWGSTGACEENGESHELLHSSEQSPRVDFQAMQL